jgi:hypothetical protein
MTGTAFIILIGGLEATDSELEVFLSIALIERGAIGLHL